MADIQRARDYATQQQFDSDVVNIYHQNNYSIEGKDAKELLHELSRTPAYQAEAREIARDCAEQMIMEVFVEVFKTDPTRLSNLRKNWVQAALLSAEDGYAKTGDPDTGTGDLASGRILSKLVARLIIDPERGLKQRVIQRAIEAAPNLTSQQMNSLSVLSIISTRSFRGETPSEIGFHMNNLFDSYYGHVATTNLDYSYMESCGVGTVLYGTPIYQKIRDNHIRTMRKSFRAEELPESISDEDRVQVLEDDPNQPGFLKVREDQIAEVPGLGGGLKDMTLALSSSGSRVGLRSFLQNKVVTSDELHERFQEEWPKLADFLDTLDAAGAFNFQVNTIGYMLAKEELDLRFPGSDVLGPVLQFDPPTPGGATEPHSSK
jgi:hypothetical protein